MIAKLLVLLAVLAVAAASRVVLERGTHMTEPRFWSKLPVTMAVGTATFILAPRGVARRRGDSPHQPWPGSPDEVDGSVVALQRCNSCC